MERGRIRIASYNIHGGLGCDGYVVPKRIARVIGELDADVVALQEVDYRYHVRQGVDQLRVLAEATGDYGNGLLTRHRAVSVRRLDLSVDSHEPRGAIDVELDCNGWPLRILATHLGLLPEERREQTQMLLRALEDRRPMATILLGDLNEWFLWGRPLRWLHAHFQETPAPSTFPSRLPFLALDRIWIKPRRLLRWLAAHRTPLARVASDHLPIAAEVERGTVEPGEIDTRPPLRAQ